MLLVEAGWLARPATQNRPRHGNNSASQRFVIRVEIESERYREYLYSVEDLTND